MTLRRIRLLVLAGLMLWSAATDWQPVQAQASQQDIPKRREDCLLYNPNTLKAVPQIANMWLLTDGRDRMFMFDRQRDAENTLALAERYNLQCFIGRHASTRVGAARMPRPDYVIHYWKSPTGKTTTISPETCTSYNPTQLRMSDKGSSGWIVSDGQALTLTLDNENDALAALALARQYTARCTIGRDDFRAPSRDSPRTSRVDYWK